MSIVSVMSNEYVKHDEYVKYDEYIMSEESIMCIISMNYASMSRVIHIKKSE